MAAPRVVFDETRAVWRLEYAGMLREHHDGWQVLIWYQAAWQSYNQTLDNPPDHPSPIYPSFD
jgi:hypothetical protein